MCQAKDFMPYSSITHFWPKHAALQGNGKGLHGALQEVRAAAEEARRKEAEQEAEEEAARQLRQAKKQQSPAGPFPASFIPHKTAQCPSVLAWQQDNSVAPQCSWPLSALMRMR